MLSPFWQPTNQVCCNHGLVNLQVERLSQAGRLKVGRYKFHMLDVDFLREADHGLGHHLFSHLQCALAKREAGLSANDTAQWKCTSRVRLASKHTTTCSRRRDTASAQTFYTVGVHDGRQRAEERTTTTSS